MQRFIYERSDTDIRDRSLAYSFIYLEMTFSNKNANEVEVSVVMNNHYLSTDLEAKSEARVLRIKIFKIRTNSVSAFSILRIALRTD